MILIDLDVVIDIFQENGEWQAWSMRAIEQAGGRDVLALSPIVVAEVAPRVGTLDDFLERIGRFGAIVAELDIEAAYAAGVAFNAYRQRRRTGDETARSIIADFFIGGQALLLGASVLTRDARFYRSYFPTVPLITPDKVVP